MRLQAPAIVALSLLLAGSLAACRQPWRAFSPENGRFSVQLPGNPEERQLTLETSAGPAEAHVFGVMVNRYPWDTVGGFCAVTYADMPVGLERQQAISEARSRILSELDGTVEEEAEIAEGDAPGVDLMGRTSTGRVFHARIFLHEGRIFELVAMGDREFVQKAEEAFFPSFEIG